MRNEYNSPIDEVEVPLSQAFEYDQYLDRRDAARMANQQVVILNNCCGILESTRIDVASGQVKSIFSPMQRQQNSASTWCYFLGNNPQGNYTYIDFDTVEEALRFLITKGLKDE